MKTRPSSCREIQLDLIATAAAEAASDAAERVGAHVSACAPCRTDLGRYRAIDRLVGDLRQAPAPEADLARLRERLAMGLADLRRRLLRYGVCSSPVGRVLIATSEDGVALVRYLDRGAAALPRWLARAPGVEMVRDGAAIERLSGELREYLEGGLEQLGWRLDLRLAPSPFHREVLQAAAALPRGAVTSYARLAFEIGRPAAVRAVAQALRRNPLPIVVPCHRVVGSSGTLTGYAGNRIMVKERLLALERIPLERGRGESRVVRDAMYVRGGDDADYCLPTCGSLPFMTLARLTLFASRAGAEAAGLRPCESCRPDLHPLAR